MAKQKILVIEDDKAIRRGVVDALAYHGYEVSEAGEAEAGKDLALSTEPDLILLDLKLPRKSGFEVLEWIKKHPAHHTIPVVILSSSKQTQDLKTAYELGANSYLVKPTGFTELNQLINDLGNYWFTHNQTLKMGKL